MSTYWKAEVTEPSGKQVLVYSEGQHPVPSNYFFEYESATGEVMRARFDELWEGDRYEPVSGHRITHSWNSAYERPTN